MSKTNIFLTVALVIQILFFGLVYAARSTKEDSTRVSTVRLLDNVKLDAVTRISVETNDKDSIIIERNNKDRIWVLPGFHDYPADPKRVGKNLGKLVGLESNYIVSKGPEHYFDLEVGDDKFQRKITLESEAGATTELYVGTSGTSGFTHVRVPPKNEVYAVDDLRAWEFGTRVNDWAKREYVNIEKDRLVSLEIKRPSTRICLERTNARDWTIDKEPANKEKVDSLVGQVSRIELTNVMGKLSDPEIIRKVKQGKDPVTITLGLAKERVPDAIESSATTEKPASDTTKIVEQRIIHLAAHPEKKTLLFVYIEGASHAVEVDRWRLEKLLEIDSNELRAESPKDSSK